LVLEAPFYNLKQAVQFYSRVAPTFLLKYAFRTDKDITTSFRQSKDLLKRNTSIQNQYIEINTGTHHNLRDFPVYKDKLKEILER
jgi:uncharacterized protein